VQEAAHRGGQALVAGVAVVQADAGTAELVGLPQCLVQRDLAVAGGALAEQPIMGMTDRLRVIAPDGSPRQGAPIPRLLWGPTCDSLDRIPGTVPLPADMQDGDYIVIDGMGAYSTATVTRFNGYGGLTLATVRDLADCRGPTGHHRPCA